MLERVQDIFFEVFSSFTDNGKDRKTETRKTMWYRTPMGTIEHCEDRLGSEKLLGKSQHC